MSRLQTRRADPSMLRVLDELDLLIAKMRTISDSLERDSKSWVDLKQILERIERLRAQIACVSTRDVDWVGIAQVVMFIAQYVTELWK